MNLLFKLMMKAGISGPITPLVVTNRSADSDTGVAPFAVQFDASGTTSINTTRPFHELYHSWNFGDEDVTTWGYGTQAGVAKKNRASGPIAAHVYETAGTYTVNYTVIDPLTGQTAAATKTITVTNPDTVFAGTNTICVANGTVPIIGDCPAGADRQNVTTWAGVIALMATGKRILLKKGDTWNCGAGNGAFNVAGPGIVGSYGTGAKPKILITAASTTVFAPGALAQDWRIMDLEGDATGLATGTARNLTRFFSASDGDETNLGSVTSGRHCTLLRVTHNNSGALAHFGNDCTAVECVADNLNGGTGNVSYFTTAHENISVLGCSAQGVTNGEHNCRIQGTQRSVFSNNTFTNPPTAKHAFSLRGYSSGGAWTAYSEEVVISNNAFASAFTQCVMIHPTNTSTDNRFRDIIFERNSIDVSAASGSANAMSFNGGNNLTARNNLIRLADTSSAIIFTIGSAVASNGMVAPPVDGAWAYNNSFFSSSAAAGIITGVSIADATVTNVTAVNNLFYLPSHTGTKTTVRNTVGAVGITSTTNTGDGASTAVNPNFTATPPVAYTDWKCTSGYTLNAGTTVPVYDDFFGAQRIYPTADLGAVNP